MYVLVLRAFDSIQVICSYITTRVTSSSERDRFFYISNDVNFVMLLHHKLVSTYPELKSSDQLAIVLYPHTESQWNA